MINVTKTFLPPQEEYQAILSRAWKNGWITNRGELVQELETKVKEYLGVTNMLATTNGTLPLQMAIKALGLTGEIITTPFSYVATTSSIVWEGCTPVFVDIDPEYLTIDETKIEAAITPKTSAILATHVFGNPCAVEEIEIIANKHNLKVIYDAAHCFGVRYKSKSIFEYGDLSTCSFHATKLFHTGEGGAIFCSEKYVEDIYYHHNFGHLSPYEIRNLGTNAKMSELQAALGLAILPYMESILQKRREAVNYYTNFLKNTPVTPLFIREGTTWNYSYYPILFSTEKQLLQVVEVLEKQSIFPRRYFYPSLEELPYINSKKCKIAKDIAHRILCLPLSNELTKEDVKQICSIINEI